MRKQGLPPIADQETRLFILGSLPGDRSLREGKYYAHPTNQFWKLMGILMSIDLVDYPYEQRLRLLAKRGIGLWDVFSTAEREGSADHAIRNATRNSIGGLKRDYPNLEAIGFNGGAAASAGFRLLSKIEGVRLFGLPSSSGMARLPIAEKARIWAQLAPFLRE